MTELTTVKVDRDTHRLVGDLAHLLGRSRRAVVRDAVNAFAAWREALLEDGLDGSAQRIVVAGARHAARAAGATHPDGPLAGSRHRIGAARDSEAVDERLTMPERFERHHAAIERDFAELGARHPRLVDPRRVGHPAESVVIAVDFVDPDRPTRGRLVLAALERLGVAPIIVARSEVR
ncbi:hypothetical protein GCM10009819_20000 [Agromyces tropicus]|uniref:Ribbon-helix-helix protein, CopG family n=1 Tax=Agromyces tropicus TaxID=555371 RepID=A0ABN2UDY4_9MICO